MFNPQYNWFQAIPALQFDTTTLSGSFVPINVTGFADNIKIMTVFNGGAVAVDYSFDGITFAGVWPAGATLIVDLQSNHAETSTGAGTLNGKVGQVIWVRTSLNPTFLTIGGYR